MKDEDEAPLPSRERSQKVNDENSKYFNVEGKKRIFCISVGKFDEKTQLTPLKNHHTDRVGQLTTDKQMAKLYLVVLTVGTRRYTTSIIIQNRLQRRKKEGA